MTWAEGSGKTKTASELLRLKCSLEKRLLRTLIICPIAVLENWKREILTHTYIEEKEIQVIDGTSKVKPNDKILKTPSAKRLAEQLSSGKKIFLINTEKVGNKTIWQDIYKFSPEFLIVDESHRFKDFSGVRVKALHKLVDDCKVKYRFILTGSPILNSELDIWAQFYILDHNILGKNFYAFRLEYFYDANASMPSHIHFPNWTVKDHKYYKSIGKPELGADFTINKLNEIIYRYADRVMKKDVLDLPPITYQRLEVPMGKEQARLYDSMKEDAVACLNSTTIDFSNLEAVLDAHIDNLDLVMSANIALVKLLRLQQLVAGVFVKDESKEIEIISNTRLKVLEDLLEELSVNKDNKIIIWSIFSSTYEPIAEICKNLDIGYTFLTGLQSKDEKQANIDKFNNDEKCRVIIANQGAGGTGVNLTAANYSVYFTRSFKLEHDLQSEARNYRGGQKRNVTRIDLVTPNSIDEDILQALEEKKVMSENVLATKKDFTMKEIFNLLKK